MDERRNQVLQAEAAIHQLAEELARAKGIADSVEVVERRLDEAAKVVSQSQEILKEAQRKLDSAVDALSRASDQLSQISQALPSRIAQAIEDFGKQVNQTLQRGYQSTQEHLITAIGEARKTLINAANSLTELRKGFEQNVNILMQQNEHILQHIIQQDAEIKRLSNWLKFCIVFSCFTTLGIIAIIIILLLR